MSAAMHVILASQAAARAARLSLLERFRISDATQATRAQSLSELGIERTSALDDLMRDGAVREAAPGRYYLDEPTVAALERTTASPRLQATRAVVIVLAILLLLPLIFLAVMRATG